MASSCTPKHNNRVPQKEWLVFAVCFLQGFWWVLITGSHSFPLRSLRSCSERPDSKYFIPFKPRGLHGNHSAALLKHTRSHLQSTNEWPWLCSNKASHMKTGRWMDAVFLVAQWAKAFCAPSPTPQFVLLLFVFNKHWLFLPSYN